MNPTKSKSFSDLSSPFGGQGALPIILKPRIQGHTTIYK